MEDGEPWRTALLAQLRVAPSGARWQPGAGSALNATWRLDAGGGRWFVKINTADRLPMFEAEAAGLAELAHAKVLRVPVVAACGRAGRAAYLALEWLAFGHGGGDGTLGHALAALHRVTAPQFGWHRDNTIGTTRQTNGWADDWCAFFRDRRLAPQLAAVATRPAGGPLRSEGEKLLVALPRLLAGHAPSPSLLHGDLWGGNAATLADGQPVVFDPAVYYGDRETDLAMTELFGGFAPAFHAAYREAWPLPPGYSRRRTLYNLYHVLNHANLFGGSYFEQARRMIRELLADR